MKVVAIAIVKNEADIAQEGVREALRWADHFIVYDSGSTDGTPDLAEAAGAIVLRGPVGEPFNEGLREHPLVVARDFAPDWVWRIDIDEIYHPIPDPRALLQSALDAEAVAVQAAQAEFWITLQDVARGLILEDERVSVQLRRRWYTIGHMAMVAWRHRPDLFYSMDVNAQRRRNVPILQDGRDVSQLGARFPKVMLQRHYNCRSLPQLLRRMRERTDYSSFGKYRFNLIVDQAFTADVNGKTVGLHYLGPDGQFDFTVNHDLVYQWYEKSMEAFDGRRKEFRWEG
jgi:hypothetical protein